VDVRTDTKVHSGAQKTLWLGHCHGLCISCISIAGHWSLLKYDCRFN
jgi:hypothetical protein